MQLANFTLRQKLWLLLTPALIYFLFLNAMVISQQHQLSQIQGKENFIIISFTVSFLTFAVGAFMLWVSSVVKHSFEPVMTHSQNLVEGKLDAEIKLQGSDETNQLLELEAKLQSKLRENQHVIDYYQRMTDELCRVFAALANGDISESIFGEYAGDLDILKTDINDALNQLRVAITDIEITTEAASKGELDQRVDLTGKQGFLKALSENINQNLNANQLLLEDVNQVFQAISEGNLTQTMQDNYTGDLQQIKDNVNNSLSRLNNIMSEIKDVLNQAAEGQFDSRVITSDKQGFFLELGQYVNANLDTNQNVAKEVMQVFSAVSAGNLSQTMQGHYAGNLAQLKQNVNDSITQLNSVMNEIRTVINASANGILDKRIDVSAKQGFFLDLSQNINNNLDVNQLMIEEVMRVFAAVSAGDLTQTMSGNYAGSLEQLKQDVNSSVNKLDEVMGQIREAVTAAGKGLFDNRIPLENKQGFFFDISENLNRNLDTNQGMVEELMRVFAAMAIGDLTQTMQNDYQGGLDELKQDVNRSVARLNMLFEELMHVFSAMSGGDLTQTMKNDYKGRLAELKNDINNSVTRLNDVMAEVGQSSEMISTASSEVLQGNISLSQRTEEQAAALEETASSMQEMTDTVQQNADNAEQANQLSISARKHAEEGGKVVNRAIIAMDEINKSSRKVSDIIGVIDEIAFQTNLLALNAAVEAARAGEQGRGFAVVATEVRNLAQRSAASAKEIKALIQDSVAKVNEGSTLVDQSGKTLEEIVVSVKKVSDIVAEIAAASREQSAGILQVNNAVTQMDEMTQQNAALVEELSGNSDSMKKQVTSLSDLLSFFKFNVTRQELVSKKVKMSTTQSEPKPSHEQQRKSLDYLKKQEDDLNHWESF
jgi:methyl-accepting chemotaxis protein